MGSWDRSASESWSASSRGRRPPRRLIATSLPRASRHPLSLSHKPCSRGILLPPAAPRRYNRLDALTLLLDDVFDLETRRMNPQAAPAVPSDERQSEQVVTAAADVPRGHPAGFYFFFWGEF